MPSGHFDAMRRFVIAILILTAAGLALTAWDPQAPPAPVVARAADSRSAPLLPADAAAVPDAPHEPATGAGVRHKYRYLLEDLAPGAARTRVLDLLMRREAQLSRPPSDPADREKHQATLEAELGDIDEALRAELHPLAYASYEMLRESDVEQYQLEEYTGGLREIAPLAPAQERAVLEAKLRQKRLYAQIVQGAGLERETLSLAEREHALSLVESGLGEYRDAYLAEVAPLLDERQYRALANFEATEFHLELERLQQIINAR